MRTEFAIDGADCPVCLNETLDNLRGITGIRSIEASSTSRCLVIEHDDFSIEELITRLHDHLHGTATASNEIVMTDVVPTIAIAPCAH
jgi:hypothetical protein